MPDGYTYDVFISYSSKDAPVVRPLAERLRETGTKVWYDEWALRPGDDMYREDLQALETSRKVLLCMSRAAFESPWVQGHIRVVLARDPTNQDRSLIPLLLADCDIPLEIRRFVYVDYRNETAVAWQNLLLALLKDPGP